MISIRKQKLFSKYGLIVIGFFMFSFTNSLLGNFLNFPILDVSFFTIRNISALIVLFSGIQMWRGQI